MSTEQQQLVNTDSLEAEGLYYAHQEGKKEESRETLFPPESAEDVLDSDMVIVDYDRDSLPPDHQDHEDDLSRFLQGDPTMLFRLDEHTKGLSIKLEQMINGLHTNLEAMSSCVHQSITLHGESVDTLHTAVDSSVKALYTFLSQFNELHDNLQPIKDLSKQINDVNETLKVLERLQ